MAKYWRGHGDWWASNQLLAALLVHLAEVEARGLHRRRLCDSLYTYCVYELRFSEDEAARRSSAARLVKAFPALFHAVANGELHLTGLLMIGPHLTTANHGEVLARAKFRTKKEIAKLVRELAPLPDVPDLLEPIGRSPRALRNPTWEEFVTSLCPPVRELRPGERPSDWIESEAEHAVATPAALGPHDTAPAQDDAAPAQDDAAPAPPARDDAAPAQDDAAPAPPARDDAAPAQDDAAPAPPAWDDAAPAPPAWDDAVPARSTASERTTTPGMGSPTSSVERARRAQLTPLTRPQYQVQFTTSEEHARLIARAKALLGHAQSSATLGDLHLRAMRLFVAALERRATGMRHEHAKLEAQQSEPPKPSNQDGSASANVDGTNVDGTNIDGTNIDGTNIESADSEPSAA